MAISMSDQLNDALVALFLLPNDGKEKVLEVLTRATPTVGVSYYERKLREVEGIPRRAAREIVRFFLGAYNVAEAERDVPGIAEAVANNLQELKDERLTDTPEDEYENFKKFLSGILEANLFGLSAKALGIMTQHKTIYSSADLISDIRGVFDTSAPEEKPQGAVIVHNLRVETRSDTVSKELYVALDIDDVKALQEVLRRAIQKHSSLRKTIEDAGVTYIGLESELDENNS